MTHLGLADLLDLAPCVELAQARHRPRRGAAGGDEVEVLDGVRALEELHLQQADRQDAAVSRHEINQARDSGTLQGRLRS
jgi:hypothetical protein